MRPPLDGAVVLVTGASSGIGRELARQLAPRVKSMAIVARRKDRLEELAAELKKLRPDLVVSVQPGDLMDRAFVDALPGRVEQELGRIDVLVNNAGLGDFAAFDMAARPKIDQMLEVNVVALTHLTHKVVPGMIQRGRGGILMISSGFGLHWLPGFGVYSATKHYVTALSEILRLELSGTGVVVTQICPGPVRTEFEEIAAGDLPPELRVPRIFTYDTEGCVRVALRGFSRGRALVVPGFFMWLVYGFATLFPRWVKRLFLGRIGRKVRAITAEAKPH